MPVAASIGGLVNGIGSSQGIFNSIKDSLFNSQTLGGLVSVGASIGLDAIGAPPILQSFIPGILGQLTAGATGSTGGGGGPGDPSAQQQGESLFKKITDGIAKFGKGIVAVGQQVISFGQKIFEGGVNLVRQGLAKAADLFSNLFERKTIEALSDGGRTTLEQKILSSGIFDQDNDLFSWETTFGGETIRISHLGGGEFLVQEGSQTKTFRDIFLGDFGTFFSPRITIAETLLDGIRWSEVIEFNEVTARNEVKEISLQKTGETPQELLVIRPYEHTPIIFENGVLISGRITGVNGLDLTIRSGKVETFRADPFKMLGDADNLNIGKLSFDTITVPDSLNFEASIKAEPPKIEGVTLGDETSQDALDRILDELRQRLDRAFADQIIDFLGTSAETAPNIILVAEGTTLTRTRLGVEVDLTLGVSKIFKNPNSPHRIVINLTDPSGIQISGDIINHSVTLSEAGNIKAESFQRLHVPFSTDSKILNVGAGTTSDYGFVFVESGIAANLQGDLTTLGTRAGVNIGNGEAIYAKVEIKGEPTALATGVVAGGLALLLAPEIAAFLAVLQGRNLAKAGAIAALAAIGIHLDDEENNG